MAGVLTALIVLFLLRNGRLIAAAPHLLMAHMSFYWLYGEFYLSAFTRWCSVNPVMWKSSDTEHAQLDHWKNTTFMTPKPLFRGLTRTYQWPLNRNTEPADDLLTLVPSYNFVNSLSLWTWRRLSLVLISLVGNKDQNTMFVWNSVGQCGTSMYPGCLQ